MESLPKVPKQEPVSFKPGGALENLGGMSAKFGDVEMQVIASPNDPQVCVITGLEGKNTVQVMDDMADAIKRAGFKAVEYRPDHEDGRAAARIRLFESLKKKVQNSDLSSTTG